MAKSVIQRTTATISNPLSMAQAMIPNLSPVNEGGDSGGGGANSKYHRCFKKTFLESFLACAPAQALFGRMLCTSCIFVMVVELTSTTFL